MINTNQIQIKDLFNNLENQHSLFVYEPVNFNNNEEALIEQNTNNTINLKFIKEIKGAYISTSMSPQVKVIDEITSSVGLKITTDYVFITNEDMSFLEQTNKSYFFTINKMLIDNDIYFIGENSIKSFSNIDDEFIKLDEKNLSNLWSISLQPINKINIAKNSKVKFQLIDEFYDIEKAQIINNIGYTIDYSTLIQTLEVYGDLYNINNKRIKKNTLIDYEFISRHNYLPLFIKFENLNQKSTIRILNFDSSYQLNLDIIQKLILFNAKQTNDSDVFTSLFKVYTTDINEINKLKKLFYKIVSLSWAFNTNFNVYFDKTDAKFIEYFANNYANTSAFEYINNIVNEFLYHNPSYKESYIFKIFKALCNSLSYFLTSPFSWQTNSNIYQKTLWWYLTIEISGTGLGAFGFENNGKLKDNYDLDINLNYESKFFRFVVQNNRINRLINLNTSLTNFNKYSGIVNYPYLPEKITTINESKPIVDWEESNKSLEYLTFLIFNEYQSLIDFLKKLNQTGSSINKTVSVKKRFLTLDLNQTQLAEYLKPANSIVNRIIRFNKTKIQKPATWKSCKDSTFEFCTKEVKDLDTIPDDNGDRWCYISYGLQTSTGCDMSKTYSKTYKRQVETWFEGYEYDIDFEVTIQTIKEPDIYFTNDKLVTLLETLYSNSGNTIYFEIKLSQAEIDAGWRIKRINSDVFNSIFGAAIRCQTLINGKYYELIRQTEFQKLDNTITKTRTIY